MEIYHLLPNTTYEFRIWGNNHLGAGDIASTIVQTLAEFSDEGIFFLHFILMICIKICFVADVLRILMRDAKDFDVHVWFYAVGIVMGAMVLLGLTVCILLVRDCYEDDGLAGEWFLGLILLLNYFHKNHNLN